MTLKRQDHTIIHQWLREIASEGPAQGPFFTVTMQTVHAVELENFLPGSPSNSSIADFFFESSAHPVTPHPASRSTNSLSFARVIPNGRPLMINRFLSVSLTYKGGGEHGVMASTRSRMHSSMCFFFDNTCFTAT